MRSQELQVERNRASLPSLVGGNPEGWMVQLQDFMENSARGMDVIWQPAGGGGPGVSNQLISGAGHRYGGFLPNAPGPANPLAGRRLDDLEMVITVPTICWQAQGDQPDYHPRMVSCSFPGYHEIHKIYLRIEQGGLRFIEGLVEPADFPNVDLISSALDSQDLLGLVDSVSRRAAAYAKRWEELVDLPERYEPRWQPHSSILTIITNVGHNLTVTLDIPHEWPWPADGELKPSAIRVLASDGIPYHRDEAIDSISAELAADAARAGGNNQGGLASILEGLENKLRVYASRCRNDCEGNGFCDTSVFPPECRCYAGYTNDDCSHVAAPTTAPAAARACETDLRDGPRDREIDCMGGTGKCSCVDPFFGADCSLRPCAKRYLVRENVDVSLGEAYFKSLYEAMGWEVSEVRLSATNGDPPPPGSIAGDRFSVAASAKGVAYIVFVNSEDAMAARSVDPFYRDSIPSRGIAELARDFPEELRAQDARERHLLSLFGEVQTGALAEARATTARASATARRDTLVTPASTPTAPTTARSRPVQLCHRRRRGDRDYSPTCCSDASSASCISRRRRARCRHRTLASTPAGGGSRCFLSCMMGVALGASDAEHCPRPTCSPARRATATLQIPELRVRRRRDWLEQRAPDDDESDLQRLSVTPHNISQIHLYAEEPCRSVSGWGTAVVRAGSPRCRRGLAAPRRRIRPGPPRSRSTSRRCGKDMAFSRFYARPGIRQLSPLGRGRRVRARDRRGSPLDGATFRGVEDGVPRTTPWWRRTPPSTWT